jgi:hypothetical protein
MFVESHPNQDITLEGALKLHRPLRQAVANLASRAIGGSPRVPLKLELLRTFVGERGFAGACKSCEGVCKSCIAHVRETRKSGCSFCVRFKKLYSFRGKACPHFHSYSL